MPRLMPFATALMLPVLVAGIASADPKWDKKGHHRDHVAAGCPPGLAKKSPACIPPGQAKKYAGPRVGQPLRIGDYVLIRDPRQYDLERRSNWSYYRDADSIYRVDNRSQKLLAVMDLVRAFSN
ncbi:hypothetical protein [Paracoccus ravus]|uniref:hypothetical protein n=1 Tax=Paracoccus ravus TaxID=2447760 RepID=UPI001FD66419|nr:hypothetical protein [Paracoccus ravus]